MAIAQVHELAGMTQEMYDRAMHQLNLSGPPPGSLVHMGGPMDGGWRIIEVWESEEAADRFYGSESFQQMAQGMGIIPDIVARWPMENVLK